MLTDQLINQHMEQHPMAPYTTTIGTSTTGTTGSTHVSYDQLLAAAEEPPPPPYQQAPEFTLQQNTQAAELSALNANYPAEVRDRNFQVSALHALVTERQHVRTAFAEVRRMKAILHVLQTIPLKYRPSIDEMVRTCFTSRQRRQLQDNDVNTDMGTTALYDYRSEREEFIRNKERFSTQQAEFNQRSAMIRQKPNIPKTIDTRIIAETVAQWDNVWGISIKRGMDGIYLLIRIGLCDIIMEESAPESRYDYPASIMLAPCYFTIKLNDDGSFICRSDQNHVSGLSRENEGTYNFDFHPHQLSDSPCFGTYGQTFIDLAIHGEIIALISGIIAFYSQYNSEDSAGVNARMFHPANLPPINDISHYTNALFNYVTRWNYHIVNESKLNQAMERYTEYHEETCIKAPP